MNFFKEAISKIQIKTIISILLLLFIDNSFLTVQTRQLSCLTGYKILTRQAKTPTINAIKTIDNLQEYSLSYRCLCPNDYFGEECSYHKDITCYLYEKQGSQQNSQSNSQQQHKKVGQSQNIQLNISLALRCWVKIANNVQLFNNQPQINKNIKQFIQLNQYLSQHNIKNNFDVQNQFGKNVQIIWANKTSIFDSSGNVIFNQEEIDLNSTGKDELNRYIKQKIIGENLKLLQHPFEYISFFLNNFGLINGQITYQANIIKPSKGIVLTKNIKKNQIVLNDSSINLYIRQYVDIQTQIDKNKQIIQDIRNKEKEKQLINNKSYTNPNDLLQIILAEFRNQTNKETIQKQFSNNAIPMQSRTRQPKNLPIVNFPLEANILQSAQFQAIRIQLSIINNYQQNLKHTVSMNSPIIRIELNQNIGVPTMYDIDLTVIQQQGMKTYMQLIILVLVLGILFLLIRYVYRWHLKLKKKKYLVQESQTKRFQMDQQTILSQ